MSVEMFMIIFVIPMLIVAGFCILARLFEIAIMIYEDYKGKSISQILRSWEDGD